MIIRLTDNEETDEADNKDSSKEKNNDTMHFEKFGIDYRTLVIAENITNEKAVQLVDLFETVIQTRSGMKILFTCSDSLEKLMRVVACFYVHSLKLKPRKAIEKTIKTFAKTFKKDTSAEYIKMFYKSKYITRGETVQKGFHY